MPEALDEYRAALSRLVARGEVINNNSVSREAGRLDGSIKRKRPGFAALIEEIDAARRESCKRKKDPTTTIDGLRGDIRTLSGKLDASLAREVSLLHELRSLKEELTSLRGGGTVVPILRAAAADSEKDT
ncbi:hypothetical protein [Pseudorhodoferax sp. Leaf265]|uniref:hypothetical protein n=1 Tax=Pseudorhodoferax sp. Leaf265 TaxID=1736315 RepID=UPI0007C722CC|nr:hypothetical protein [Pseudorhodoferax sp. Leaf265]